MTPRDKYLLKRYDIDERRYDLMFARQDGVCDLSGHPPKTRRLQTDHDHKTKRVRGLLCFRCNKALLEWMSPEWLRAAAAYKESSFDGREL